MPFGYPSRAPQASSSLLAFVLVHALALGFSPLCARADGPLAGAEERARRLASFRVPEGLEVEVVAEPPLVERPMLVSFDDEGALYVADSAGVNWRGPQLLASPPHVIRRLVDEDGDGRFDKSGVFADKLVFPQGIVWHRGWVYVSSPPSFWRMKDTDGDGVADVREELLTGFANTGVADDMHGGSIGPDGRVYWFSGRFPHEVRGRDGALVHKGTAPLLFRARLDGSEPEVVCGSQGNAVGVAFTPEGDMFACGTYLAPPSMGAGLRDAVIHCVDGGEYPVRDRVLDEHRRTGDLLPPLTHLGVAAAADLAILRTDALGVGRRGALASALFNLHKVALHRLERKGATFQCRNDDLLVSTDTDFHPTDVAEDADGSLLVVNTGGWFRIGCPTSQVAKPEVLGAIYRLRSGGAGSGKEPDPRGRRLPWSTMEPGRLATLLDSESPALRDRAIDTLALRGQEALDALEAALGKDGVPARLGAVWALSRIEGDRARALVRGALSDKAFEVRQAAARVAGLHRDARAASGLRGLLADEAPSVRREAATSLGRVGLASSVAALLEGLKGSPDRFLEHALIFALLEIHNPERTRRGLDAVDPETRRGALIALCEMEGGGLQFRDVRPFLSAIEPRVVEAAHWVIERRPEWASEMPALLATWLSGAEPSPDRQAELERQMVAFTKDGGVRAWMAAQLSVEGSPAWTRDLILDAMGQAVVEKLPTAWASALTTMLKGADLAARRRALAALRGLPRAARPKLRRVDRVIDFPAARGPFAGTQMSRDFAVEWRGVLLLPAAGEHRFRLESDDGSRLSIDGVVVVDHGGFHAMSEAEGKKRLAAGDHELLLEFFQGAGESGLQLLIEGPGGVVLPHGEVLFHREEKEGEARLAPGLLGEYYAVGPSIEGFVEAGDALHPLEGRLLSMARDPRVDRSDRLAALDVALAPGDPLDPALFQLVLEALHPGGLALTRLSAADLAARALLDDDQALEIAKALSGAGAMETSKLLQAISGRSSERVGLALVAALESSPILESLRLATLRAALDGFPPSVRAAGAKLLNRPDEGAAKTAARIEQLSGALEQGEVARGRELFFGPKAGCSTCHTVRGSGGRLGPDLSSIGAIRTKRDLLEAIVAPSASFARGYEPYEIILKDGTVHAGVILRETPESIHIVKNATTEARILRDSIESLEPSAISIMPEGLDRTLQPEELADIISFLASLQ